MRKMILAMVLSALCVVGIAWGLDVLVATPGTGGWQYLVWTGTADSSGMAEAITAQPLFGNLRAVYYQPVSGNVASASNTPVLAVKTAWRNPSPVTGYSEYSGADFAWDSGFDGADPDLLYEDTADLFSTAHVAMALTGCQNAFDRGATFRFVFVFAPELSPAP